MRSKIFKFFLGIFFLVAIERFCHFQTGGFRLNKAICCHEYPFHYETEKIPSCLHQSFHYLGKGVQFYAFLGEDQQTILKLFKHHHLGPSIDVLKKIFPRHFVRGIIASREKRMCHLFRSAKIAIEHLPKETGVLFLHVGKAGNRLGQGKIYDKMGNSYDLDFDTVDFLLQKRAIPVKQMLDSLFQKGLSETAITRMNTLIQLIENRSRKGIKNKDGNILENCGFVGENPVELDIGSFVYRTQSDNPDPHGKAGMRARLQLLGWVKQNYPDQLPLCKKVLLHEKTF